MAFDKHRHDQMHRGQVPADQLATGTPADGDVPTWDEDAGGIVWGPAGGGSVTLEALAALGLVGTVVMSESILDPPEPVWSEDGTSWLYSEVGQ